LVMYLSEVLPLHRSEMYATWINFMHNVFSPLIRTPSRKQLSKHVPQSF
jgi:hypothetical protein